MPPKQPPKKEAFRAFVAVLKPLLQKYRVRDADSVHRDASHEIACKFYRKLLLKVHPDKGGDSDDFKKLQAAKEKFDNVGDAFGSAPGRRPTGNRRKAGSGGAGQPGSAHPFPAGGLVEAHGLCEYCGEDSGAFRVQAKAVLLTYNGVEDVSVWDSFKTVVGARLREWKVRYYGARGPCYGSLEWAQWLAQPARVMQSCCVWLKVLRARSVYPFLRAWLKMFLARDVWNSLPFYLYSSRNATPTNLDFCAHACSKRFCATL